MSFDKLPPMMSFSGLSCIMGIVGNIWNRRKNAWNKKGSISALQF